MSKKNILLVTDRLYPNMSANSEIVYRIAKTLKYDYNCDITILGYHPDIVIDKTLKDDYRTLELKIDSLYKRIKIRCKNKLSRIIYYLTHFISCKYLYYLKISKKSYRIFDYKITIAEALKKDKYDCIIVFGTPFESATALCEIKSNIPFIIYKLDPWSQLFYLRDKKGILEIEKKCDAKANAIITTDIIKKESLLYSDANVSAKIIPLEFPNLIRYEKNGAEMFSHDCINCVFCGSLYKTIRNPQYAVKLFKNLGINIVFHIFGRLKEGLILDDDVNNQIIYHGYFPSDEALSFMQSADILVNIGNTEMNLLPSKILTYISLGKPILNIIKNPECPTLKYTKKYPLALNVLETEEVLQEDIDKVTSFILDNKGKEIPFEQIKELYRECTPEYVGDRVYEIICDVIEKSRIKTDVKSRK